LTSDNNNNNNNIIIDNKESKENGVCDFALEWQLKNVSGALLKVLKANRSFSVHKLHLIEPQK